MKRLLKWTARLAAIVWAILFIACAALWIRSYWITDEIGRQLVRRNDVYAETSLHSYDGLMYLCYWRDVIGPTDSVLWRWDHRQGRAGDSPPEPRTFLQRRGFLWDHSKDLSYTTWPIWFMQLLLAVPLAAIIARHLPRRRFAPGLCPTCGYDLRATTDRCPECGSIPYDVKLTSDLCNE